MNPVSSMPLRLTSILVQVLLAVTTLGGAFLEFTYTWIPYISLGLWQVISAIFTRILFRTETGRGRKVYENIIAVIGIYFLFPMIFLLVGADNWYTEDSMRTMVAVCILLFTLLMITPLILRLRSGGYLWPWVTFAGTMVVLCFSIVLFSETEYVVSVAFLGLYPMLLVGPLLAIFYLSLEWMEWRQQSRSSAHTPLDI